MSAQSMRDEMEELSNRVLFLIQASDLCVSTGNMAMAAEFIEQAKAVNKDQANLLIQYYFIYGYDFQKAA